MGWGDRPDDGRAGNRLVIIIKAIMFLRTIDPYVAKTLTIITLHAGLNRRDVIIDPGIFIPFSVILSKRYWGIDISQVSKLGVSRVLGRIPGRRLSNNQIFGHLSHLFHDV